MIWEYDKDLHQLFFDFQQAYDTVTRDHKFYKNMCGKIANKASENSIVKGGLQQALLNIVLDAIKQVSTDVEIFSINGQNLFLAFTDDIDLIRKSTNTTKELFGKVENETKNVG